MKKAIASFALGPMASLLEVAMPTFQRYAETHGYDLVIPDTLKIAGQRHPSWLKIPLILKLFEDGYDTVVWIDADVVILRHEVDILQEAGDAPMAMAVHHTGDGAVPNCGVWVVRPSAASTLIAAWELTGFARSPCWWEQAAIIATLGGDPDATPVSVPPGPLWSELPYHWNPHVRDQRGFDGCRFFHATSFPDRRAAMAAALSLP
jgi:hypothetical protein